MKKVAYDGERMETGVIQFGEDLPGLYIQATHFLMLDSAIRSLLVAAGADSLLCNPILLEAIMKIYGVWDSIGCESYLYEIVIAALPHRPADLSPESYYSAPLGIECDYEQVNKNAKTAPNNESS